jgi:hypothetical protein
MKMDEMSTVHLSTTSIFDLFWIGFEEESMDVESTQSPL